MQPANPDSKTERLDILVTPAEKRRLAARAAAEGKTITSLLRGDLPHLLEPGGHSLWRQLRLWYLQVRAENLRARKDMLASQRRDVETRLGGIASSRKSGAKREGAQLRSRAGELAREESDVDVLLARNELEKGRVRDAPAPRVAAESFRAIGPVVFLGVSAFTIAFRAFLLFVTLALLVLLVVWIVKRFKSSKPRASAVAARRRFAAALHVAAGTAKKDEIPAEVAAMLDKGHGLNARQIKEAFWVSPAALAHRLRKFLGMNDGLEELRKVLEDAKLEWIDDDGKTTDVHVIVATEAEWSRLPLEFKLDTCSRRVLGAIPPEVLRGAPKTTAAVESDDDAEDETPAEALAREAQPARRGRGRPKGSTKEAMEARRKASEQDPAPGLLPHQPPLAAALEQTATNGHGKFNGNGAAAPSGGESS